jgi:hypothetical protein
MSVDTDILEMLNASPKLVYVDEETGGPNVPNAVYWGYLDIDETAKVIAVPLPYLVYSSSPGYDRGIRYSGSTAGRVSEFRLKGVGESERQAKWVLNEAYKVLNRKRLNGSLIRSSNDSQDVRRDDDYTRPDGKPLFFGVERYAVGI